MLAVFQKTGEGPVYVSETEQAEVIGLNLRSPQPATFVGQPARRRRYSLGATHHLSPSPLRARALPCRSRALRRAGCRDICRRQIFLGKLVDAGAAAFFGDLNHAAADLEIPV